MRQLLPLFQRRIDAGWVVAAAVEQHDITRLRFVQTGQQAIEIQLVVGGIVVSVFAYFQPGSAENAFMVRPAWVAYPYSFYVGVFGKEISRYAQAAGAARGLGGAGALIVDNCASFTKQQLLSAATKLRNTINTEVVFGGFIFQQILLGFFTLVRTGVLPVSSL